MRISTCLPTLEDEASKRNLLVLGTTKSSGSRELDEALLKETGDELAKGWADGPWTLEDPPLGPLFQGDLPCNKVKR